MRQSTGGGWARKVLLMAILAWAGLADAQEPLALNFRAKVRTAHGREPIGTQLPTAWKVVVLLHSECPICIKYTLTLQQLAQANPNVSWLGVFTHWEGLEQAQGFAQQYALPFPVAIDERRQVMRQLGANVTPEVFLLDAQGQVLYRGAIDNWFVELGKPRRVITERYLADALAAVMAGKTPQLARTPAIGCVFR